MAGLKINLVSLIYQYFDLGHKMCTYK